MTEPSCNARDEGQHECFDLDGARVHGNPNMSDEARNALREVIAAAKRRMAEDQDGATDE